MPWPHLLQTLRFGAAASCADSCCHSRQRWQAAAASPATPSSWQLPARRRRDLVLLVWLLLLPLLLLLERILASVCRVLAARQLLQLHLLLVAL